MEESKETAIAIPVYEVSKNSNGHLQLEVDGKQSICPFAGAVPINTQGGIAFYRQACTTACPMVEIKLNDTGCDFITRCGCMPIAVKATLRRIERVQAPVLTLT